MANKNRYLAPWDSPVPPLYLLNCFLFCLPEIRHRGLSHTAIGPCIAPTLMVMTAPPLVPSSEPVWKVGCSAARHSSSYLRNSICAELFYRYGVDVVIEAHEHSYERLWPVYNETVTQRDYNNPLAPVHIISGAAGCNEQDGICFNAILGPKGPWSAFRSWLPGASIFCLEKEECRAEWTN